VIVVVAVVAFVALVVIPRVTRRASGWSCANNLKQIGLSFQLFAQDNSGKFPTEVSTNAGGSLEFVETSNVFRHFQALSNELSTPGVLLCPKDSARRRATNFTTDFNNTKVSYFVGVDATRGKTNAILTGDRNISNGLRLKNHMLLLTTNQPIGWTKELHVRCGYIALADASVQSVSNSVLLRRLVGNTGVATNRLAIP